ncbi:MAG: WecB/TagA/CpsF family glycosyltransferase [Terriglobales bacterium]
MTQSAVAINYISVPTFDLLGVRVHAVQIPAVIAQMEEWIERQEKCHFIAVTDMHSVMEAQHEVQFKVILNSADLVVPDGFPIVWLGRRQGFALPRRVYGPELMVQFCADSAAKGYRHFFYGGAPGVAEDLARRFSAQFPGLIVAGTFCAPFRPVSQEEDEEVVARLNNSNADIVWVALGAPKQERWMFEHRELLRAPVLVGVGAAFDFCTGRIPQAPVWMRENGLEWLSRLFREPRRLWRRYLIHGSEFAVLVLLEALGWK